MKNKLIALLIFGVCAGSAMAQSGTSRGSAPPPPQGSAPPHGKNAALDAALSECAASVAKESSGRPDRSAMDACMTAKGFTKPPRRGEGGDRPPPPSGSSSGSASSGQ